MQYPITIVGGGMVGLSLALMLAQQKIQVRLLEAIIYPDYTNDNQQTTYHSSFDARNSALSRRSVQIYQELGLWEKLQQYATPILQVHISEQGGFGKAKLVHTDEGVESFGQVIENAWLGRVLINQVRQNNYIELVDGIKVTALQQDENFAYLTAQRGDEILKFQSSLIIAADGRDSFCRQALGIGIDVHDYEQVAIVTTVQTSKPHQQVGFERFSPLGPLALLPLPGEYRRSVVWPVKKGSEQEWLGAENDQHFLNALQHAYGDRAGKFEKTGQRFCYPLSQVLAHKQVAGRVILMGNAAHTIHPVAGQGFNLCLRDAYVLIRYLAHQHQQNLDFGDAAILSAYEQARLKDQKKVIFFCDRIVRGFSNQHPLLKFVRNTGLLAFDLIPGVKPMVANFAMGLKA